MPRKVLTPEAPSVFGPACPDIDPAPWVGGTVDGAVGAARVRTVAVISVETPNGPLRAEIEIPAGEGPWPGVVVLHDALGLGDDHRAILKRIAAQGYLAIAPNLYSRGGVARCVKRVYSDLLAHRGEAFTDILAAREALLTREDCNGKVAVAGFCMGGGFALVASPMGFEAAAPFYPSLLPSHYDAALDGACPIVASHGARDPMFGRSAARKLEETLTRKGIEHDVKVYEGAGHSFANRLEPQMLVRIAGFGYNEAATEDAWNRVFAFFAEHLTRPAADPAD